MTFYRFRRYPFKKFDRSTSPQLDAVQTQELEAILAVFVPGSPRFALLTPWEREFLASVSDQKAKGRKLTLAQFNIVKRIGTQRSQAALDADAEWNRGFDAEKQSQWNICLNYYRLNGFFRTITSRYTTDCFAVDGGFSYVPDKYSFEKLTQNKYAQKFIEEYHKPSRFNVGDLVAFPTYGGGCKLVMVVTVGIPKTHFKHSRLYTVEDIQDGGAFEVREKGLRRLDKKWEKRVNALDNDTF